ncbi:retrovirus-related pol polyprotein from transposon TNT 1-94, partial [Tanacetum coccineum]
MGRNRSFPITFRYEEHTVLKATTADEALLWHRRLGHLNFQSLNSIHQKNMVGGGLPQIHEIEGVCEGCALGKQHRKPFPKGVAWRAKEILELVHTDLCGPMRSPSHEKEYNSKEFDKFCEDEGMHRLHLKRGTEENLSEENQPSHDEVPSEEPDEESQSPPPRKFCSLTEIYNANFCHVEPKSFEEAIREESWKKAMD